MNPYWLCPDEQFCPRTSGSRWRCDSLQQLFQKMLKMKNGHHFQAKKTSATPDFCKQNWSRTHRFGVMNFLSSTVPLLFSISPYNREGARWRQKIHYSKTVHPRSILFTEIWGSRSFFCLKVVSIFHFEHFLEQLLQTIAAPSGSGCYRAKLFIRAQSVGVQMVFLSYPDSRIA